MNNLVSKKTYLILGIFLFLYGLLDIIAQKSIESYVFFFSIIPLTYGFVFEHLHDDERSKLIRTKSIVVAFFTSMISIVVLIGLRELYNIDLLFVVFSVVVVSFCSSFVYYSKKL
ncbi:MAG: hypothetical protein ACQEWF_12255 [Bacillota bacterium]